MAPQQKRYVDELPSVHPRPAEMQVLCLGLSRTSTMSMRTALEKLGYKAYHFAEIFKPENIKEKHMFCWHEALKSKVNGEGKPYSREEFDKILGRYSAVTDAPNACFVDELLAAYPDAKIVLGLRDPDKWVASMETSYYRVLGWKSWPIFCYFHKLFAVELEVFKLILSLWTDNDIYNRVKLRAGFIKHNEYAMEIVSPEKLLLFRPEQGWEPLCKFLGKDIPDEPYPRVNEGSSAADLHSRIFWYLSSIMVLKAVSVPLLVGGVAWGLMRYGGDAGLSVVPRK